jgi:hypothetical protein
MVCEILPPDIVNGSRLIQIPKLEDPSRYISGDSMSSLLLFYHEDNILLTNLGRW